MPPPDNFVPRKPLVMKSCVVKTVMSMRKRVSGSKEFENGSNKIIFPLKSLINVALDPV